MSSRHLIPTTNPDKLAQAVTTLVKRVLNEDRRLDPRQRETRLQEINEGFVAPLVAALTGNETPTNLRSSEWLRLHEQRLRPLPLEGAWLDHKPVAQASFFSLNLESLVKGTLGVTPGLMRADRAERFEQIQHTHIKPLLQAIAAPVELSVLPSAAMKALVPPPPPLPEAGSTPKRPYSYNHERIRELNGGWCEETAPRPVKVQPAKAPPNKGELEAYFREQIALIIACRENPKANFAHQAAAAKKYADKAAPNAEKTKYPGLTASAVAELTSAALEAFEKANAKPAMPGARQIAVKAFDECVETQLGRCMAPTAAKAARQSLTGFLDHHLRSQHPRPEIGR